MGRSGYGKTMQQRVNKSLLLGFLRSRVTSPVHVTWTLSWTGNNSLVTWFVISSITLCSVSSFVFQVTKPGLLLFTDYWYLTVCFWGGVNSHTLGHGERTACQIYCIWVRVRSYSTCKSALITFFFTTWKHSRMSWFTTNLWWSIKRIWWIEIILYRS